MTAENFSEFRKPPIATTGLLGWLRMNLFSSWFNTILTFLVIYFLYQIVPSFFILLLSRFFSLMNI